MNFTDLQQRLEAVQAKQDEVAREYDAVRQEVLAKCTKLCAVFHFTAKELGIETGAKRSTRAKKKSAKPESVHEAPQAA